MIGIVVVSHSRQLGNAAVDLANEMVAAGSRPQIAVAAGLDEMTLGTDAAAISEAITAVDSPDGVLVLVDLGSAILSAQMALEFVDPDVAAHTRISPAPLVEGLVAAIVTASLGAKLEDVAAEAANGLLAKQQQIAEDEAAEESASPIAETSDDDALKFVTIVHNEHGLHARPAANLVSGLAGLDAAVMVSNATTGKGPVPASSLTLVQTLGLRQGDQLAASISGPDADKALDALNQMANNNFGESQAAPVAAAPPPSQPATPVDATRNGRQLAIGPACHASLTVDLSAYVPGSPQDEIDRFNKAQAKATAMLDELIKGPSADIYEVQKAMLDDQAVCDSLRAAMTDGTPATRAIDDQYTAVAAQLEAIDDPYFKARAEDQRGLRRTLLQILTGHVTSPAALTGILIIDELDPLTVAELDPTRCAGIITTHGGGTGHGVLLAQARGFAVLPGCANAQDIPDGQLIAFDPVAGRLWPSPSADELAALGDEERQRADSAAQAAAHAHEPAVTKAGARIVVEANIASVDDAHTAYAMGAEGSGLVRTEVLFANWTHAPTAEEQAEIFITIGQALGNQSITVRTWDPGGDKPLPFLQQAQEINPMLGERGVRAMKRLPHLLDEQLKAILLASRQTPVQVMFPMISLPDEVRWARARLDALQRELGGTIKVGMMVETPSAAARAADYRDLVDFISVGTNDLTQYTMAVDRGNALVADIARGPIEGVWSLMATAAAAFAGKPVAVCGDLASHSELVARLISIGVTELSVRGPLVGLIKQAVRAA